MNIKSSQNCTADLNNVPLAIIGIGCIFPKADNLAAYWSLIEKGTDAITEIPESHWKLSDYYDPDPKSPDRTYGNRGGFISAVNFNPMEYNIPPNALEAIDTSQLLGLVAAGQALNDAGYGARREFDRSKVSVILGVTGTLELVIPLGARLGHPVWRKALKEAGLDDATTEDVVQRIADAYVPWQENSFPGLLGNVVAGRISKHYDLGGTNCVVDAACASSFSALHLAAMELTTGKSNMVITGGVDTFNDIFMYTCFSKTPALSPDGNAKPFDISANGTTLGEGLGLVVLKRLEDAEKDGDRIYAVIKGIGTSSDGKGDAIYAPSSEGQQKALQEAYRQAGVTPTDISLVEAHGTGTKAGDLAEIAALRNVYGDADSPWCALGSVKSQIGHTKAAAGAAGLIKTAMALHHKILPPTIKVQSPLPELTTGHSPFYLNTKKRPWASCSSRQRTAAVSAFGFGGSNFHIVLEEYSRQKQQINWDTGVQLFTFSADDVRQLDATLAALPENPDITELRTIAAKTRKSFKFDAPCRLGFVVEHGVNQLSTLVTTARRLLEKDPDSGWVTPDGISYAVGTAAGLLAMLFPGQGSQYTGMLQDLACDFPAMQAVLANADLDCIPSAGKQLSDLIYPPQPFSEEIAKANETALRNTAVAQPAIGAVSLGAANILAEFGCKPDMTAGHSYGELTALAVAGRYDESSFHLLSRMRGRLMSEGDGDKGGMLAVSASIKNIEQLLADETLDLVIANRNAPNQFVLSGCSTEIDRAYTACLSRNLTATRLSVAAAFHSGLVADAAQPFMAALEGIEFKKAETPVFANSTGKEYPSKPVEAKTLLAKQLACPVEFITQIKAMYAAGARTFLETGPGARLTGLVAAILEDQPHTTLALDASSGKRNGQVDLARCLGRLATLGYQLQLEKWDAGFQAEENQAKKPVFSVAIGGANYVKPKPVRPPATIKPDVKTGNRQTIEVDQMQNGAKAMQQADTGSNAISQAALTESLRVTREGITILQKMQEDTARLHQRFLEGQETATRTIQALLMQQQSSPQGSMAIGIQPSQAAVTPSIPVTPQPVAAKVEEPTVIMPAVITAPPSPTTDDSSKITETLLSIVAEKTGYPVEMLELEMGMDSDLGIDSIKRVEILSALQEKLPQAPVIGPEQLDSLHTLGDIASYLQQGVVTADKTTQPVCCAVKTVSGGLDLAQVTETLLSIVAEKTGYPVEMLELEMGMDSDLGIDSIKRVEILSALQEKLPQAPVIGPEQLGSLHTLGDIASYLQQGVVTADKTTQPVCCAVTTVSGGLDLAQVTETLLSIVAEKTGYPVEMLELEMGMDSDLGIDSIKRVEILSALQEKLPQAPVIGPEQLGSLHTLGDIASYLCLNGTDTHAPQKEDSTTAHAKDVNDEKTEKPLSRSTIKAVALPAADETFNIFQDGEIWVTNDASPFAEKLCGLLRADGHHVRLIDLAETETDASRSDIAGLVIISPVDGTDDQFLENSFLMLKNCAPALRRAAAGGGAFFTTVSRLDGFFGCGEQSELLDPLSGGLAGLVKTASKEWSDVICKAVDIAGFETAQAAAAAVKDELFSVGPLEVGLTPAQRTGLELVELSESLAEEKAPLAPGDVVVVTGGGRGVTTAAVVALAAAFKPVLLLLGRSSEQLEEPEWLHELLDESDIKKAILVHAKGKLHPRDIEEQYRAIMAGRELRDTLARVEAVGGQAIYRSVDIRDNDAVCTLLETVRNEFGPIRGIVHGAGVLADRLIMDKTKEQFNLVYGIKVSGLRTLLAATDNDDLRFITLFGSTTGRFGRKGQVDYAVANEVLNKLAQAESRRRPDCRVVSFNWGPWDGGMVTPALKKVFADEGIGLISLQAGGTFLTREIATTTGPVELVALVADDLNQQLVTCKQSTKPLSPAFNINLALDNYPFLTSHVMDGKAVLPMAMIMEWFAQGALHDNPGLYYHGINDLRICKGVTLRADENIVLQIMTGRAEKQDSLYHVPLELVSTNNESGRIILHAKGEVVLARQLPEGIRSLPDPPLAPYAPLNNNIYDPKRLFHGPDLHGIRQVTSCSPKGIAATVAAAPAPSGWLKKPLRNSWLGDPLALDAAFQMMILWSFHRFEAPSLPCFGGRYRQYQESFPKDGVNITIRITSERDHGATADIEFLDLQNSKLVARLENYECIIDPALANVFARNSLEKVSSTNNGNRAA